MIQLNMTLGMSLSTIRRMKGLSQAELAKKAGCSRNQISLIERDLANTKLDTIIAIAEAMDYTVDFNLLDKAGRE